MELSWWPFLSNMCRILDEHSSNLCRIFVGYVSNLGRIFVDDVEYVSAKNKNDNKNTHEIPCEEFKKGLQ